MTTSTTLSHTMPLYRCEGGGVAQCSRTHQKSQPSLAVATPQQFNGHAAHPLPPVPHHRDHLATSSRQVSDSSMDNVKGHLLRHATHRSSPPACAALPAPLPNAHEIRFKPAWESRSDGYTGKTQLIQLKHVCD